MASKDELYISVEPQNYKISKSNILGSQANLLKILKHFQNLKVLARQKEDLKKKLHKSSESLISQMRIMQEKIPTPKVPRDLQHKEKQEVETNPKKLLNKRGSIEEELVNIQEKLDILNS